MTDTYRDWPPDGMYPDYNDPDILSGHLLHNLQDAVQQWYDFHRKFALWVERDKSYLTRERDRLNELLAMIDDPYGA